ncbi:hypothetical protein J1605_009743 [Eschrichtius robustus]|uniref:Homocysteine-responsive endoplasmic reticulum-resident ubiquitin-like domain member 2 protein n=1 Tax=Eschrichtius robustus TaxID=9764 RepID=A0AB34GXD0_ESCRO|nr:hypothetical protein J1605_009743 [Eschrichtius robustus]
MADSGRAHAKEYFPELLLPMSLSSWRATATPTSAGYPPTLAVKFLPYCSTKIAFMKITRELHVPGYGGGIEKEIESYERRTLRLITKACKHSSMQMVDELTKDQRLVYSGRLLPDHLQLKDILRKQDEYHMVHLVCTSRTPPSSPKSSTSRESHEALTSSSNSSSDLSGSSTPSSSQETLSLATSSSSEGLRQRTLPQAQTDPAQSHQFPYVMQGNVDNQLPGQAVPAGFPVYPAFSPLQMLWWQQMYAHQYYMQYQAAVSAQATSNANPAQPAASQPLNLAHVPGEEPPPAPNLVAQENRPMNENVQMNAQGGPVLNEEDFNRDWLDWMYTFSRAAILLSIVYFYSSFSRFIMVMGAMLLVYLHQAGWFPFRQEGGQQQAPNNNAEVNNDAQNANNLELEEMVC